MVYFHKIADGTNTIVCKSAQLSSVERDINGKKVEVREQGDLQFGLLCLPNIDPRTLALKKDQELPGFQMSEADVLDQKTKEPTGLKWVEPA